MSRDEPPQIDAQWVRDAVDRYEGPLRLYAARLLGGDLDRAHDVVQEAFLRLCDQEKQKIDDHLAQWLYTVCRNLALNINRKERRMGSLSRLQTKLRPTGKPGPQTTVDQQDEHSRARQFIDQLPQNQQEVIRLKFQHELTYRQIAKITGQPLSTVGYLIHTGLETVRKQMSSNEVGPRSD